MIAVRVTCDTGNTWATDINGTIESATEYFMGKSFVRSDEVTVDTVVSVELI